MARREALILLAAATGRPQAGWLAHPDDVVPAGAAARLKQWVRRRRRTRVPIPLLTGRREFMGLSLVMRRGVFVPRPETEGLVERVEAWLARPGTGSPARIIEPCTGSGAIAVALARRAGARVIATDRSLPAVRLARLNARRQGVGRLVAVHHGNLLAGTGWAGRRGVDVVVANPPYIRAVDRVRLPPEVRRHDPAAALFAGPDGLGIVRRLAPAAAACLRPGGLLALEIGHGQGRGAKRLLAGGAWRGARVEHDLAGRERYLLATRTPSHSAPDRRDPTGGGPHPPLRTRGTVDKVWS